ncbi:MAG: S26 family signal peptidase [Candidatus Aminicenantes bacterium]|nr:S26 family signal peptidase [Candidatus Aminicenantes bacterium]
MKALEVQPDKGISLSAPVIIELIEAVHEKEASFRFQANGYSMTPAIRDGDIITVSPLNEIMPRRGDVLAFRHPDRPLMLVHRVLHTMARKFFVKGDNCPEADGWIPAENILGLITRVERQGKIAFWPDRHHVWARFYFRLYTLWPPVRRIMVRGYHFLKNNRRLLG